MTNNTSWTALVNANTVSQMPLTESNVKAVKKAAEVSAKTPAIVVKMIQPKRYSIDDNGGGYRGL